MITKDAALLRVLRLLIRNPRKFYARLCRYFRPMRREYSRRFSMNLKQWLLYDHKNTSRCSWMGIVTMKNPCDAWICQEIIYEVKPDVIVEIGSFSGGSTLYFANILDILGKGVVISIDIDRSSYHVKHDRIIALTGDSASPEIIAKTHELCSGKKVMLMHDGNHAKEHVLKDLYAYSGLVTINSYLIIEDSTIDLFKPSLFAGDNMIGSFDEGPLLAIDEFLLKNPNFIADSERERYILTNNPRGFLKRIK